MIEKLTKWLLFSVLVSLLPIGVHALHLLTFNIPPTMEMLFSQGELLLIGCAISAGGIGEIIVTNRNFAVWKMLCGGMCVVTLMIAALWFSDMASYRSLSEDYDAHFVAIGSVWLFGFNVISALGCILISEV